MFEKEIIRSRDNSRLKAVRKLRRGRSTRSVAGGEDLLLLEGPHLLGTALDRSLSMRFALVSAEQTERYRALLQRLQQAGVSISAVSAPLFREAADTDTPQGILAVARRPPDQPLEAHGDVDAESDRPWCRVYLDGVQDPGNVGAVVRSAAAAGCDWIAAAPGTCSWHHPRALRASAGTVFSMGRNWNVAPDELHPSWTSAPWYGLDAHAGTHLWNCALPDRVVLVVGSESHGLSPQAASLLAGSVNIPTDGSVESLNASIAASIVLFEWKRQQLRRESAVSR